MRHARVRAAEIVGAFKAKGLGNFHVSWDYGPHGIAKGPKGSKPPCAPSAACVERLAGVFGRPPNAVCDADRYLIGVRCFLAQVALMDDAASLMVLNSLPTKIPLRCFLARKVDRTV